MCRLKLQLKNFVVSCNHTVALPKVKRVVPGWNDTSRFVRKGGREVASPFVALDLRRFARVHQGPAASFSMPAVNTLRAAAVCLCTCVDLRHCAETLMLFAIAVAGLLLRASSV